MRRPARSELREHGKMPIQKSNCADFLYQIHILPYLIRLFGAGWLTLARSSRRDWETPGLRNGLSVRTCFETHLLARIRLR